ncbi:TRAM domain-containing protein [Paraflavitalea speifideaquila]|uniref:TRAM domain-containing protein n=1 Tax=Paraflavitalea speifideaquila TaxID=3076558 RepID=UPI0028ECCB09|nr:TRAM domain-containing protein [Paraflavitalea speifideiaquila]
MLRGYPLSLRHEKKNVVLQKMVVQDYAAKGKALAKIDGKVVFIEGAVPGDVVDVRLSKNKKEWAEGKAVHFHEFSRDRVAPFANILVYAGVVSGRCCLTTSNWSTSSMRWNSTCGVLAR